MGAIPSTNGHRPPGRVLHLRTVSRHGGGPEKTLLNSPRFLKGAYDLLLAYIRPEGDPEYDMPERARQMGVDLVDIPERNGRDPRTLWRLVQIIKDFRPDILHPHDYKTNVLAVILGRWFRIPTVTTMHGYVSHEGRLPLYYRIDQWALRHLDHVIAVSADLERIVIDLGIPAKRRSLVHNAIDAQEFSRSRSVEQARQQLGVGSTRPLIGAVGRLGQEKGFDVLIRAVDRLLQRGVDVDLMIVGEGEDRPRLEALIGQLGRSERIRLLGHRKDVKELYEAMDVFALSSLREGLPNVVLEAMAMEVPVVATRVAGVPALINHDANGLLVDPGNLEGLTESLARLLGDAELRQRLRQGGRETVETRFSFAARMEKIRAIYDALRVRR
jgi:glycosyltransferase involved in cell wall biosynthesis